MIMKNFPDRKTLQAAFDRVRAYAHETPVLTSETFNRLTGGKLYFKCENFQKGGAFKFRGAVNSVFSLTAKESERGVATHSSGNHAQAVALAARMRNIPATIVMPENAPQVKVNAVKGYGARVVFCPPTLKDREESLEKVISETGAEFIHPSNDLRVIAGQGTATIELLNRMDEPDEESGRNLDLILSPVGGGGLLSGTALAARYFGSGIRVIGCEPARADDAYRSFYGGTLVLPDHPDTIADGLKTSLGSNTFPIIRENVDAIVLVEEDEIADAMRLVWERMKIVIEASAAVPVAAVLNGKVDVNGRRVGIIISGGNVDLGKLPW